MNTTPTLASEDVLQKLKSYSLLLDESQKYSELIKKMKQRQQASDPIFKRVHDDYQNRKSEIDQSLVKEREEFVREYVQLQEQNKEVKEQYCHLRSQLKELNFRYILGEYSEKELEKEGKSLMIQVYDHMKTLSLLEEVMYLYLNILGFDTSGLNEGAPQLSGGVELAENTSFLSIVNQVDVPAAVRQDASYSDEIPEASPVVEAEEDNEEEEIPPVSGESKLSDAMKSAAKTNSVGTWTPPQGQLTILEGSCQEEQISLATGDVLFGSTLGADVLLEDSGVAEAHARVFFKDQKYYMKNLDPMGRSYVNGAQQNMVELNDGDVIRLGDTMIMRLDISN